MIMETFTVTYWTNESKTIRAASIQDAAKQAGYSVDYQDKFAWSDEETGQLHVINFNGDHCATITRN
jgi:hypothetical protein